MRTFEHALKSWFCETTTGSCRGHRLRDLRPPKRDAFEKPKKPSVNGEAGSTHLREQNGLQSLFFTFCGFDRRTLERVLSDCQIRSASTVRLAMKAGNWSSDH